MRITLSISENPSKSEEVTLLAKLAESLPADTYIKPWLRQVLPAVESSLRSDVVPMDLDPITVVEHARREAAAIVAEGRRQAEIITRNARGDAKRIEDAAAVKVTQAEARVASLRHRLQQTAAHLQDTAALI